MLSRTLRWQSLAYGIRASRLVSSIRPISNTHPVAQDGETESGLPPQSALTDNEPSNAQSIRIPDLTDDCDLEVDTGDNESAPSLPAQGKIDTSPKAKVLPLSMISEYVDIPPPTLDQLKYAESFFTRHSASILYSAAHFHQIPLTETPEVAFLGRSNVGKSSLLNALVSSKVCRVSSQPGRTRTMNAFAIGGQDSAGNPGKINVLDMPGYGFGSDPAWGIAITRYLLQRRQLKRVFLLVDAHTGVQIRDRQMLELLRKNGISHQVLLSKIDKVLFPKRLKHSTITEHRLGLRAEIVKELFRVVKADINSKLAPVKGVPMFGMLLGVSAEKPRFVGLSTEKGGTLGINSLRCAVLVACGLAGPQPRADTLHKQGDERPTGSTAGGRQRITMGRSPTLPSERELVMRGVEIPAHTTSERSGRENSLSPSTQAPNGSVRQKVVSKQDHGKKRIPIAMHKSTSTDSIEMAEPSRDAPFSIKPTINLEKKTTQQSLISQGYKDDSENSSHSLATFTAFKAPKEEKAFEKRIRASRP